MRIGIDCRLPYYQMGGISQYVLHLLPALAALDKENEYVVLHSRKDGRSHLPQNAPNFRRYDLWTPCHHRLERWALSAELLPLRLDVLHSPDFIPPAFGARRHVITIHDLNFIYYPQFLTQESLRYYREQIEWAVQQADLISSDSEATRQDLINEIGVPPEKVKTIRLAANPLYAREYDEAEIETTLREYDLSCGFILAVGTLEPRKNLPLLIRAYARMQQAMAPLIGSEQAPVPLILLGRKGWLFEEIFDTINAFELQGYVRHLEGIFDEQLAHLYRAAGVLVTPSHYEGFGLPALEAMHGGCPVIVSDRGSLPEVVGEAGIILPADDELAWADAIERVLTEHELRASMIEKGYKQAGRFSWRNAAQETLGLYLNER